MSSLGCYGKSKYSPTLLCFTERVDSNYFTTNRYLFSPLNFILIHPLIKIRNDTQAPSIQSLCSHYHNFTVTRSLVDYSNQLILMLGWRLTLQPFLYWNTYADRMWQLAGEYSPRNKREICHITLILSNVSCRRCRSWAPETQCQRF
jgi:hypothetical protein